MESLQSPPQVKNPSASRIRVVGGRGVAVVVDLVAERLALVRVHVGVRVVAVLIVDRRDSGPWGAGHHHRVRVAGAVAVGVGEELPLERGIERRVVVVAEIVAVVVPEVADFLAVGVHQLVGVVAVEVVRRRAQRRRAGLDVRAVAPVAVAVVVGVVRHERRRIDGVVVVVHERVAVVVGAVADLDRRRVPLLVVVVAVGVELGPALSLRRRTDQQGKVAVPEAVGVEILEEQVVLETLVAHLVAVVVEAVAGLDRVGVDLGVVVGAVATALDEVVGELADGGALTAPAVAVQVVPGVDLLVVGAVAPARDERRREQRRPGQDSNHSCLHGGIMPRGPYGIHRMCQERVRVAVRRSSRRRRRRPRTAGSSCWNSPASFCAVAS